MNIPIQKLEDRLMHLPDEIYQQEKKTLEAKEAHEMAKITHETQFSFALLRSNKPNATEKRAEAITATEQEKRDMFKASLEYEKQNAILTAKNNEFIALRKVASIEERLMQVGASGN